MRLTEFRTVKINEAASTADIQAKYKEFLATLKQPEADEGFLGKIIE